MNTNTRTDGWLAGWLDRWVGGCCQYIYRYVRTVRCVRSDEPGDGEEESMRVRDETSLQNNNVNERLYNNEIKGNYLGGSICLIEVDLINTLGIINSRNFYL